MVYTTHLRCLLFSRGVYVVLVTISPLKAELLSQGISDARIVDNRIKAAS